MMGRGAFVVIFDDNHARFLMHERRDFRIWSLPGGHVEAGEATEDAAVRETWEETGYHIRIKRFVGEYWRPQIGPEGDICYLYVGEIIGGQVRVSGKETVNVAWFDPVNFPFRLRPMMKLYIQDALSEADEPFKKTIQTSALQLTFRRIAVSLGVLRN